MNREQRIKTAEETLAVLAKGSYQNAANQVVEIGSLIKKAKVTTKTYTLSDMQPVDLLRFDDPAILKVTNETWGAALHRLTGEGHQRIGLLNFASAKNPGGGFLNGAQAQEEALARSRAGSPLFADPNGGVL